ncbi:bifunctional metallophosphatase/5'-nucleotidase [Desertimonas flava]|uniref:bifunctional metallophosphatase/5'-nucleotidase n=1 Tax=Desertimonas flava TaxID=2064846 RepID=UPI000E34DB11|nr:5'-nucleotidase C-terminal domain-containing protein [Desertimonas flava]
MLVLSHRPRRLAAAAAAIIVAGGSVASASTEPDGPASSEAPPPSSASSDSAPPDSDGPGTVGELSITIAHINDHHSHLQAGSGSVDLGTAGGEFDYELGGFPRVAAQIAEIEANNDNVVKVHAGDAITGTLFYTLFGGEADAALMNDVCFDVFEVGNHEFDATDSALVTFLDHLNDPADDCATVTLGANVVPAPGTPLLPEPPVRYLQPYHVMEFGGERVGFIGLDIAGKTTTSSSPLPTTTFLDEAETAQRYVDELQSLGIENIVLVTHYQYDNDLALAAAVTGVDAVVGGDSHTLLGGFTAFGIESSGEYPTMTTNADGEPVCVVQAWQYAAVVGELHLDFADGTLAGCQGTPHLLVGNFSRTDDADVTTPIEGEELAAIETAIDAIPTVSMIEPDPESQELLDTFAVQTDALAAEVIGTATEPLCLNRLPGDTYSEGICDQDQVATSGAAADVNGGFIQQIVTDAFLARAFRADLALQNAGGVRIAIPAGDISVATAYELLPFSNTLVELDLTGAEIVQSLEDGVAYFVDSTDGGGGSFPYGSAIRWDVDLSQPAGSRFSNVEVRGDDGGWAPIDPEATYVVVTNSFLATGGDGYVTFAAAAADGRIVDTGIDYAQGFIDWLIEDVDGEIVVPPASEFSTQSFVPAG